MKKVELKIVGLSYSNTQAGSYVLVLSEKKGNTKIPIIIKPDDAQFIAMKMEGLKTTRPQIQDLVKTITDMTNLDLQEVCISNVIEGIFYSKLIFSDGIDEVEVECSVGSAVSLSMVYKCPILCTKEVLKISGIKMEDDYTVSDEQYEENHKDRDYSAGVSVDNLEKMLEKAISNEEYEIASQLRDRINEIKKEEK